MATVGNLFINVKARTAAFSKKMKAVRGTIGRLAKGFAGIAKKVALFGAAMAGIAIVAIIAMTKKGLAAVDTLAKLAAIIGTNVASIQILRHMATIGGVSIEKMDKSIAKMSKNIGESAMGIGTATDALKELGLKATDLEKLKPEETFGVLADAINKLASDERKASVAYDIFGRAGQELIVTMKGGSKAVAEMGKKLKELGILIGDKQANLVEQANDAWADIGLVWAGLSKQLAVHFAPVLITIATRLREMVIEFGGMSQVAEFIVRSFFMAGAGIMDMIKMVHVGWLSLQAGVIGGAGSIANALGEVFGGDLKFIGQALIDEAARIGGEINDKLGEGWDTSRVDDYIKSLKEKWTKDLPAAPMGDFGAAAMGDPAKQPTHALQSVIGSFKVEGDRIAHQQVNLLKSIDNTLKDTQEKAQMSKVGQGWFQGKLDTFGFKKMGHDAQQATPLEVQAPMLDIQAPTLEVRTPMLEVKAPMLDVRTPPPIGVDFDASTVFRDLGQAPKESNKILDKQLDTEKETTSILRDTLKYIKRERVNHVGALL